MPSRYQFTLRGHLDGGVVPALADFARSEDSGFLVLTGELAPGVTLGDVLAQFAALGLGLHAVTELPGDGSRTP